MGCDGDLVAEALDVSHGAIHGRDLVAVVKVVAPEVFVNAASVPDGYDANNLLGFVYAIDDPVPSHPEFMPTF